MQYRMEMSGATKMTYDPDRWRHRTGILFDQSVAAKPMALVHNAGKLTFGAKGKGKNRKRALLNN
jgi:hypothetical protein